MNHLRATSRTLGDEDPYIYKKGPVFGMPGVHVDGMDVLKVRGGLLGGSRRQGGLLGGSRRQSGLFEGSRRQGGLLGGPGGRAVCTAAQNDRLPAPPGVTQVREVALEAIARARRGDGPTLIECETYRYRGHSLADPDELRTKEEKAKWVAALLGPGRAGKLRAGRGIWRSD